MEQARKRLVELLTDIDYITSKDSNYSWWKKEVTVGAINNNYSKYKYLYSLNRKKGVFYIDYESIWSIFSNENNMSYQQMQDFTHSTLGERYNFGDITTVDLRSNHDIMLGERYNFGDITTLLSRKIPC